MKSTLRKTVIITARKHEDQTPRYGENNDGNNDIRKAVEMLKLFTKKAK